MLQSKSATRSREPILIVDVREKSMLQGSSATQSQEPNHVVVREEALFVLTCRAFPILRLADLTLETALPIDTSFK